jgi:hypothetical protein
VHEFVAHFVGMETILKGAVKQNVERQMTISVAGKGIDAIGDAPEDNELQRRYRGMLFHESLPDKSFAFKLGVQFMSFRIHVSLLIPFPLMANFFIFSE